MKLAIAILAASALSASAALQRDERLDIQLTPEQQEICKAGGGCLVITANDLRAVIGRACHDPRKDS